MTIQQPQPQQQPLPSRREGKRKKDRRMLFMWLGIIFGIISIIFGLGSGGDSKKAAQAKGCPKPATAISQPAQVDWGKRQWVTPGGGDVPVACNAAFVEREKAMKDESVDDEALKAAQLATLNNCETANQWWQAALEHPNALGANEVLRYGPDYWLNQSCDAQAGFDPAVCKDWRANHGFKK